MGSWDDVRYACQVRLPEIGVEGQRALAEAKVLVVGAGGLGCPALSHLVAAGVGRVTVCDDDRVERSNLHRQVLYGDADVGKKKATAASERLAALNPSCVLNALDRTLDGAEALDHVAAHDLVLDCTDRLAARFLIHDACCLTHTNLVAAAIHQYDGQLLVFPFAEQNDDDPCFRCLWPAGPEAAGGGDCRDTGVLGPVPGVFGALQAMEAVKLIVGLDHLRAGRSWLLDLRDLASRHIDWKRLADCPLCGRAPTITAAAWPADRREASFELEWEEIDDHDRYVWIDVSEDAEGEATPLPAPIAQTARRLPPAAVREVLEPGRDHVFVCRGGRRSRALVAALRAEGVEGVFSLRGGVPCPR